MSFWAYFGDRRSSMARSNAKLLRTGRTVYAHRGHSSVGESNVEVLADVQEVCEAIDHVAVDAAAAAAAADDDDDDADSSPAAVAAVQSSSLDSFRCASPSYQQRLLSPRNVACPGIAVPCRPADDVGSPPSNHVQLEPRCSSVPRAWTANGGGGGGSFRNRHNSAPFQQQQQLVNNHNNNNSSSSSCGSSSSSPRRDNRLIDKSLIQVVKSNSMRNVVNVTNSQDVWIRRSDAVAVERKVIGPTDRSLYNDLGLLHR